MEDIKNNNKILFIPGWLDSGERLGYQNSLNIWHKNIDLHKNLGADYVIAHSVGSLAALYNWKIHKNFKIILVNPVISKGGIIKRWYKFTIHEGFPDSFKKSIKFSSVIPSLIKLTKLFKISALEIINTIPKENLVIIYGENDKYLFDKKITSNLKERDYMVKEIKGVGHNYGPILEEAIIRIIL